MNRLQTTLRVSALALSMAALSSCGSSQVISQEILQAQEQARVQAEAEKKAAAQAVLDARHDGPLFELGSEFSLTDSLSGKLKGGDLLVSLVKTGWSTVEVGDGESRDSWATFIVTQGEKYKRFNVEEGESRQAFGYQFQVTHAYESWFDPEARYQPLMKMIVTR